VYCLCSDESHDDIMMKQRLEPLPFDLMISTYTACRNGCGSCIDELREKFESEFSTNDFTTNAEAK